MRRARPHPSAPAEQFALRFRLLMSYHDLTLKDIAAATRSAVSTVGTWKNGRVPSSARVLDRLAEIFHVSVEYLLTGRPAERRAGVGDAAMAQAAARILQDLQILVSALEGRAPDGLPPAPAPPRRPRKGPAGSVGRRDVEQYLQSYLDHAEREPGGLANTWTQLRRDFPLDFADEAR
jgi:transcriptional regulator with XRE-family HTH domain